MEEITSRIYSETKVELAQKDESSKYQEDEYSFSKKVTARSATEAIAKIEASASSDVGFAELSASASGSGSTSGSTVEEYVVSGKKVSKYIQYYDLYKEYRYEWYICVTRDTYGNIYDTYNKGKFKGKYETGRYSREPGRTEAP